MKGGDTVTVTYCGNKVRAMIFLASSNGRSLMLRFDGILGDGERGAYMGMMPVFRHEDGVYRDLMHNEVVGIQLDH